MYSACEHIKWTRVTRTRLVSFEWDDGFVHNETNIRACRRGSSGITSEAFNCEVTRLRDDIASRPRVSKQDRIDRKILCGIEDSKKADNRSDVGVVGTEKDVLAIYRA